MTNRPVTSAPPAVKGILAALAVVLVLPTVSVAQELWKPDLVICGAGSAYVWRQPGDAACTAALPQVELYPDQGLHYLTPNPRAPYLNQPNDFAQVVNPATGEQHLVIADTINGRVLRFVDDPVNGVTFREEVAPGTFAAPFGVIGDAAGNIIVADAVTGLVSRFSWNGQPIGAPMDRCTGDALQFQQPWRVALAPGTVVTPGAANAAQGRVLIASAQDNRIVICDGAMKKVAEFGGLLDGSFGSDPGLFYYPTGVAVDSGGRIYVSDPNNARVQVFDGNRPLQLGTPPIWIIDNSADTSANHSSVPAINYPFGLAVDANGRLLIADAGANAMWVLSDFAHGLQLQTQVHIGSASDGNMDALVPPGPPGELQVPANISLDASGRLLIADPNNLRVQRFNHPLMTVVTMPDSSAITTGGTITLQVVVSAAAGQFDAVQPVVVSSNTSVVDPAANPPLVSPVSGTVVPGQPLTFTVTLKTTGDGPVSFTVYAIGINHDTGESVAAPDGAGLTEALAVGVSSDMVPPTTTASVAGASAISTRDRVSLWYTTPPVVQLHAAGTPAPTQIHYKIDPNGLFQPEPQSHDYVVCAGADCTLPPITKDGMTAVWYRAQTMAGSSSGAMAVRENWKKLVVQYDGVTPSIGAVSESPAPNANGWHNASFSVSYEIVTGLAGLPAGVTSPGGLTFSAEGANMMSPAIAVTDAAGLKSPAQPLGPFKLDRTKPTLSGVVQGPNAATTPNGLNGYWDLTNAPAGVVTLQLTAVDPSPSTGGSASGIDRVYVTATGATTSANSLTPDSRGLVSVPVMNGGTTTLTAYVTDKAGNASLPVTFPIKITRSGPSATSISVTTAEDTALTAPLPVAANGVITVASAGAGHGTVTFNATARTFTYTPAANYNGADAFAFTASDGTGSAQATVSVTVTPVNDAPTAGGVSVTAVQGQSVSGRVIGNDVDNSSLAYSVIAGPLHGALTAFSTTTGSFTYRASATNPSGDAFTVRVSDGSLSVDAVVAVTVKAGNQNPVCTAATADPALIRWASRAFVPVQIKGVTDPDGNTVSIAVTAILQDESTMADGAGDTPIDGMIVNGGAQVRAERASAGNGRIYEIRFTASDGKGGTCKGAVTVGVAKDWGMPGDSGVRYDSTVQTNRPPDASNDAAFTTKGSAVVVNVLANDSDPDRNPLAITAVTTPGHGSASLNANGTIKYTPATGYTGTDVFTYTVSDGRGGESKATVSVTVKPHSNTDGCDHDRRVNGHRDDDDCEHDHDTHHQGRTDCDRSRRR